MIKTYLLVLALLTSDGLVPHKILTPNITRQECERLASDEIVRKSYLEDYWVSHEFSSPVQLVCIEFKPLLRKNHD